MKAATKPEVTDRPAPPPPARVPIRVLADNVVVGDVVLRHGDTRAVDRDVADRLMRAGLAAHDGVRCRVPAAALIGDTWRDAGEEVELPEAVAVALHSRGAVVVLD